MQLPEGASLERTTRALDDITKRVRAQPGVDKVVAIGGLDALNDSASLANAGIAYVILKDWSERGKGEDLLGLYNGLSERVKTLDDGIALVIPPPAIQGIGNVAGATMKVELRDGSFDYAQLEHLAQAIAERASQQSMFQVATQRRSSPMRPSSMSTIDRVKSETLGVPLGNALDALSSYVGSTLRRPVQQVRPRVPDLRAGRGRGPHAAESLLKTCMVRNNAGGMVPLGTLADITTVSGPVADLALQSLSGGDRRRQHRPRLQLGPGPRAARADRQGDAAARRPATNGRRCPIRRRRSAIRSTSSMR